jgi:hypothetical protein
MKKPYSITTQLVVLFLIIVVMIISIQSCVSVRLPETAGAQIDSAAVGDGAPRSISYDPPLKRNPASPFRGEVQAYLDSLRQAYLLENIVVRPIAHIAKQTESKAVEKGRVTVEGDAYDCTPTLYTYPKTKVGQFLALNRDEDSDVLLPGVFIQEEPFRRSGKLEEMPIARAPVTLSINLPVENTSRTIQNPSSSAIRQAVSELMREADDRLNLTATNTNLDIIPANIDYKSAVTYSFEHAMYEAGLSVDYEGGVFSAGLESAYSNENMVAKKTVICRMVQPMYTISFITDTYEKPADLFGASVTRQGLEEMERMIQPFPFYIKSVTYGRMLLYSVSSSEAESADDLKVEVDATYGGFSGSGSLSRQTAKKTNDKEIDVKNWGGTQKVAFDAIRTGDFQQFFQPTPAGNAVPLYYTVQSIYRDPIEQTNELTVMAPNCTRIPGGINREVKTNLQYYLVSENGNYVYNPETNWNYIGVDYKKRRWAFDGPVASSISSGTTVTRLQLVIEPTVGTYIKYGGFITRTYWGVGEQPVQLGENDEQKRGQNWKISKADGSTGNIRYGEFVTLSPAEYPKEYLTIEANRLSKSDQPMKWKILPVPE